MFVGPVNNAWVYCSRKKSTFKAKKKKRAENAIIRIQTPP